MVSGSYNINDHLVLVGSQSLRLVASSSPFSLQSTQALGNLSSYTGAASGAPPTGTVGIWVYMQAGEITGATLQIGSDSSNYTQVAGVKTYTNAWDAQDGWNYLVFRLKNGTTTGTPNWAAASFLKISFTSPVTPTCVVDYLTIGTGDTIALNGLGARMTDYTSVMTNY